MGSLKLIDFYAPGFLNVIFVPLALLGSWGVGHLLGVRGMAERVFVGLGVNGALLVPFSSFLPELVTPVAATITTVGLMRVTALFWPMFPAVRPSLALNNSKLRFQRFTIRGRIAIAKVSRREFVTAGVALSLTFWLFPNFYLFENHDLLYFGWLPPLVAEGTLAVDFAVPLEMGLSNNMPSLALVPFAFPGQAASFTDFVFFRAIFALFFIFLILRRMTATQKKGFLRLFGALGAILLIWGSDWAYSLLISSFFPAIGLALLTVGIFEGNNNKNGVYLIFVLIAVAKAPIAAISLVTIIYLSMSRKRRPDLSTLLISGVILLSSIGTWATAPRGGASSNGSLSFSFLGIGLEGEFIEAGFSSKFWEWAASFTQLPGWVVDYLGHLLQAGLKSSSPLVWVIMTGLSMIWVVSKYFFSFGLLRSQMSWEEKQELNPLSVWAFGAFCSFLMVRNGYEFLELGHQAHAFILVAVPASVLFLHWALNLDLEILTSPIARKTSAMVLIIAGILASTSPLLTRQASESSLFLSQGLSEGEYLGASLNKTPGPSLPYSRLQVIAAITGQKLEYIPEPTNPSYVDAFLLDPTTGVRLWPNR